MYMACPHSNQRLRPVPGGRLAYLSRDRSVLINVREEFFWTTALLCVGSKLYKNNIYKFLISELSPNFSFHEAIYFRRADEKI